MDDQGSPSFIKPISPKLKARERSYSSSPRLLNLDSTEGAVLTIPLL